MPDCNLVGMVRKLAGTVSLDPELAIFHVKNLNVQLARERLPLFAGK